MTDLVHKYRVGQSVDSCHRPSATAARENYEIVSLRPAEGGNRSTG